MLPRSTFSVCSRSKVDGTNTSDRAQIEQKYHFICHDFSLPVTYSVTGLAAKPAVGICKHKFGPIMKSMRDT